MTTVFMYPNDMFAKNQVDDEFINDLAAATALSFPTVFLDAESLEDDRIKIRGVIPEGSTVIYRGWMLSPEHYQRLSNAVEKTGSALFTTPEQYSKAHFMSGWINTLGDATFKTKLYPAPIDIDAIVASAPDWSSFFVKDYVKSVYGFTGEVVKDDLASFLESFMEEHSYWLAGGIALREFVRIPEDAVELRGWWVNGNWHFTPHPKFANAVNLPVVDAKLLSNMTDKLKTLGVAFVSADFVEISAGSWTVIEIGDGQVSGLPHYEDASRNDAVDIYKLF